jgi:AcrR family transcriptional regulator
MTEEEPKKRRNRRTKVAVDRDVLTAAGEMIEEVGFRNVTLTGVAERARIEPAVFYRRYATLDELFDRYTHKYDYWLADLAENMPKDLSEEETLKWVIDNLIKALWNNKGMQELLIWELSDDNQTTRRTAQLRELINEPLIKMLEYTFRYSGLDINVIAATIISGVYYLILHRKRSSFCGVDFNTKTGKERLQTGIDQLTTLLFTYTTKRKELDVIAARLRKEGVSEELITKCIY